MDKNVHIDILNKILSQSEELRIFVSEAKDAINDLDKKLDLHIQKTGIQTDLLSKVDEKQEETLTDHHDKIYNISLKLSEIDDANTSLSEKHLELERSRDELIGKVESLERPKKWIVTTGKILIGIGAIASATYSIYQLITAYIK